MSFQKQLGPVLLSESGGVVSVSLSLNESAGGGAVAGFVSAQLSASAQVSAKELIDAGFALAAEKFPAVASLINAAKSAVDAELPNV